MNNIQTSVRIYAAIKEQLAFEHDLLPEDQCLIDTLEGLSDLPEQIAALVRDAVRASAMEDALKIIIADNQARKQQFAAKAERLRALALWAMTEANIPRVHAPDMTISQAPGRASVKIDDDNLVPDELCRIIRKPDLIAIGEKLKSGEFIPYARFSNVVPILKVKTT
jgi:Siphovirus Gp157